MVNEAHENGGKIYLNGWFRTSLVGFAGLILTMITMLVTNVIANDKKYMENIQENKTKIVELGAHYAGIREDLSEIKGILKRTSPFERSR